VTRPRPAYELDEDPPAPVPAVLALGSNLGDRAEMLRSAVRALTTYEGLRVRALSPVVETRAVGGPEQGDYLNAVALVTTSLSPLGLLAVCQQVESEHHRSRTVRWGPRTLDIDIITFDDVVVSSRDLELPHPRAAGRAFVLLPWSRVDPEATLVTDQGAERVDTLLARIPDTADARFRPDVELGITT
jgi:2-amino-4-hydroxy-6-hydroxymethyldihydropteridine diphosphokinase